MANGLYGPYKQKLLNKQVDMSGDTIKALLIDLTQYTVNLATHDQKSDIPSGAIVATSVALANKSILLGIFDADDFVWSSVVGATSGGLVLFNDTHVDDLPVVYYDSGMVGMPVVPNGGNINVTVHASGFFSL